MSQDIIGNNSGDKEISYLTSHQSSIAPSQSQAQNRGVPKIHQLSRISEFQAQSQYNDIASKISPKSTKNIHNKNGQMSNIQSSMLAHVSRTNRQSKPQMMLQDAWGENEDDHDLNDRDEAPNSK